MTAPSITFELKIPRDFLGGTQAPDIIAEEATNAAEEAAVIVTEAAIAGTPHNFGTLAKGFMRDVRGEPWGARAVVFNAVTYAQPVEYGSRPHFPPLAPLVLWAQRKLQLGPKDARRAAHAIARSIARRGTRPARMLTKALDQKRDAVIARFRACNERIVARLGGAR